MCVCGVLQNFAFPLPDSNVFALCKNLRAEIILPGSYTMHIREVAQNSSRD